ncbi:MAG TPA: superoxide dismutase [Candidatus Dojkabacteria bacterium]|nr:superoxide dismutase [Candidatus Dojkabacteria bacterium]
MQSIRYELKPLPYDYSDLEPVISKEIMTLHHDKHHLAYVNGANSALELLEQAREGKATINTKAVLRDLSFNLNGHILHDIFWNNMRKPVENNMPEGKLLEMLNANFGSFDNFKKEFTEAGKTVEGSGWVVLGIDGEKNLLVYQLEKHNLLGLNGFKPLLVNDVWEHAYYLDYKNDRVAYIEKWWNVVNWEDVANKIW